MRLLAGSDLQEYKRYYRTPDDPCRYSRTLGLTDVILGELGSTEEEIIKRDLSHLRRARF